MFGLVAGLGAKLAESVIFGKVKGVATKGVGFLTAIPKPVWEGIVVVGYVLALLFLHQHYANAALKAQYQAGYAQAVADIKTAEAKKIAPLKAAKTTADTKNIQTNDQARKTYETGTAHVDSNVADLLRMYASPEDRSGADDSASGRVPGTSAAAGTQPADARTDDGLAQADAGGHAPGADEPTVTLPAKQVITRFGICDRDYLALKGWEQAYAGWRVNYDAWADKVAKLKAGGTK